MRRGSTPICRFDVNIDIRGATIFVTFEQRGRTILEKTGADLEVTEDAITLALTQEETLSFAPGEILIQIRYVLPDGTADASNVVRTTIGEILKDGVIP